MGRTEQLTADLIEGLRNGSERKDNFLFVEPNQTYSTHLTVSSFNASNPQKGLALPVRDEFVIAPFGKSWDAFLEAVADKGFRLVSMPGTEDFIERLITEANEVPTVAINSTMPNTINGFLPFQVHGFNMMKRVKAGWLRWDTGTGKTVGAAGLTRHHMNEGNFDLAIWAVKAHNKMNTARALAALVDIDAIIVAGTVAKRHKIYGEIARKMAAGERPTIIVNYEQFRGDKDFFLALVTDHKILMVLDEAPTKIRNRKTQTWKALAEILYTSEFNGNPMPNRKSLRPADLIAYVTSATPITNSPVDFYNIIRLIAPGQLGSIKKFEEEHVIWDNMRIVGRGGRIITTRQIVGYRNLDQIGIKVADMTHTVDKTDPDIAAMFPKVFEDEIVVDLSDHQQKLYNKLAKRYKDVIELFAGMQKGASLSDSEKRELQKLLAVFSVLQMIVDDPALVLEAADRYAADPETGSEVAFEFVTQIGDRSQFEDNGEETRVAKFEVIRELVEDNSDKVISFSTHGAPYQARLSKWLTKWGIGHVIYNGSMSMTQKQAAEDKFKNDPNCKLFLSSDAGSDSINLECANLCIHINLPWTPDKYEQRENRQHRVTSQFEHVAVRTLMTDTLPELHKAEILDSKRNVQHAVRRTAGTVSTALRGMEV